MLKDLQINRLNFQSRPKIPKILLLAYYPNASFVRKNTSQMSVDTYKKSVIIIIKLVI